MVLHDRMADLFIDTLATDALRFMTVTLDVKPEWIERIPAVCHVDGTARPQVVDPESTPFMHAVVAAYDELSGLPAVINTSFNMHEEPIVCTPQDAIRTFAQGHLDALAIGPFWVQRPEDA
jgi:carbamoyltransferase